MSLFTCCSFLQSAFCIFQYPLIIIHAFFSNCEHFRVHDKSGALALLNWQDRCDGAWMRGTTEAIGPRFRGEHSLSGFLEKVDAYKLNLISAGDLHSWAATHGTGELKAIDRRFRVTIATTAAQRDLLNG